MLGAMRGFTAFLTLLGLSLAASFAAFTVEPAGDQVVDLETGVTVLPDGGKLVDAERGLELVADYIEYKEGEFVKAKNARLVRADVRFEAGELYYDVPAEVVDLKGGVLFSTDFLKGLKAPEGRLYLKDEVAVLWGGVESEDPYFRAERMVADTKGALALLLGEFVYKDAKLGITLRGKGKEARLLLRFLEDGEVEAETEVPRDILEKLISYLGG